MKIQYQFRGLNPRTISDCPLDHQLEHLDRLIPISTAQVVLEHQRNTTPPFSASVDLAVPGPDIHAAARDHTLEAVLLKVARRLDHHYQDDHHHGYKRRKSWLGELFD